jgi:hypothetical protein
MILANMNETNQRMQRLELIINDKLSKLDLLDVWCFAELDEVDLVEALA